MTGPAQLDTLKDSYKNALSAVASKKHAVWLERYRPQTLDEVVGNVDFITQLKNIRADPTRMTNMMICGPPGVGKTTSIHALSREILGPELVKSAVLEMNASDERGIDVVREQIHTFARTKLNLPPGLFKIIILDEVDSMTTSAQQSLRTIMEDYGTTTRFALSCNISSKVIEALQSRCCIFRYGKVKDPDISARLVKICEYENAAYDDEGITALSFVANGDMRVAINGLQSSIAGFDKCTRDNVYKVCDVPNPIIVNQSIQCVLKRKPHLAVDRLGGLVKKGYAMQHVLVVLGRCIKTYEMPETTKLEYLRLTLINTRHTS